MQNKYKLNAARAGLLLTGVGLVGISIYGTVELAEFRIQLNHDHIKIGASSTMAFAFFFTACALAFITGIVAICKSEVAGETAANMVGGGISKNPCFNKM